jgi:predicted nuclease of predicted toxin-antitoxin system
MASDEEVWLYAKNNEFVLVTQDSDFYDRSVLLGFPPKVIWIQTGNTTTDNIKQLLMKSSLAIEYFEKDKETGCLKLY